MQEVRDPEALQKVREEQMTQKCRVVFLFDCEQMFFSFLDETWNRMFALTTALTADRIGCFGLILCRQHGWLAAVLRTQLCDKDSSVSTTEKLSSKKAWLRWS